VANHLKSICSNLPTTSTDSLSYNAIQVFLSPLGEHLACTPPRPNILSIPEINLPPKNAHKYAALKSSVSDSRLFPLTLYFDELRKGLTPILSHSKI
jgi:hypothetical protein